VNHRKRYPWGAHVQTIRAVLAEAQPKLDALAHAELWSKIDITACSKGKRMASAEQVIAACRPLHACRRRFGDSDPATSRLRVALRSAAARRLAIETELDRAAERKGSSRRIRFGRPELVLPWDSRTTMALGFGAAKSGRQNRSRDTLRAG
jgi:hypothetical protein